MRPSEPSSPAGRVAIVVKGYPRLSETFIAQEILGLQDAGQRQLIVSLRHPTDKVVHDLNRRITAPVLYLPEYLHQEPRRVWRGWRAAQRLPGYRRARAAFAVDLRRDRTRNRVRRFGQACVLATELPGDVGWVHAHYLHTPSSVVRYAALMTGSGWSFSAHAKDIWTTPAWDLRQKLADAAWGATCTGVNHAYLTSLAPDPGRIDLIYHGLDFSRFPAPPARPHRDGSDPAAPARLVTVGRTVPKKGFDVLLAALARLPADRHWRLTHIGGGPQTAQLKQRAAELGLADRIDWRGAQAHDAVIAAMADGDVFLLTSRIAPDGDRDGLPNVLMEAQALGMTCLATSVSAIPELIVDGETGILIPPEDPAATATALDELICDPERRQRLGAAASAHVRKAFAFSRGLEQLLERFDLTAARSGQRRSA